jgi:hypothetical protein
MTAEEVIAEQNAKIQKLTDAISRLTEAPKPQVIDLTHVNSLVIDPALVASGKVVLTREAPEEVKVGDGEIRRNDVNLSKHIEEIANGSLKVVG